MKQTVYLIEALFYVYFKIYKDTNKQMLYIYYCNINKLDILKEII